MLAPYFSDLWAQGRWVQPNQKLERQFLRYTVTFDLLNPNFMQDTNVHIWESSACEIKFGPQVLPDGSHILQLPVTERESWKHFPQGWQNCPALHIATVWSGPHSPVQHLIPQNCFIPQSEWVTQKPYNGESAGALLVVSWPVEKSKIDKLNDVHILHH